MWRGRNGKLLNVNTKFLDVTLTELSDVPISGKTLFQCELGRSEHPIQGIKSNDLRQLIWAGTIYSVKGLDRLGSSSEVGVPLSGLDMAASASDFWSLVSFHWHQCPWPPSEWELYIRLLLSGLKLLVELCFSLTSSSV